MAEKQLVKFEGASLYAQVYPGQERAPHPDAVKEKPDTANDRTYSIQVECSEELYKKLRKAGISPMQELKEIDGKNYIRIKGTHTKTYADKKTGELITSRFSDPEVVDADDNEFTALIGNGSKVQVIAELVGFPGKTLKALRLQKVKVLEHVPYEKPESDDTTTVVLEEGSKEPSTATTTESFF